MGFTAAVIHGLHLFFKIIYFAKAETRNLSILIRELPVPIKSMTI